MVSTLDPTLRATIQQQAELTLCERSFPDFLAHVKVIDPPPGRGLIPFEAWGHLISLAYDLPLSRLFIILKARQLGFSWLMAAYVAWVVRYQRGAVVLLLSKDQTEAAKLLEKVKTVLDHVPTWMQVKRDPDNTLEIGLPAMASEVRAFAATKDAGRSATATLVVQDEADFHEWLESNYAAYGPAIDAGGQLIMLSTSDKTKPDSFFKRLYRAAPENGFTKRFFGWTLRPGRDTAWRKAVEGRYETYQLEGEYPASEAEALAPARSLMAFDMDSLNGMREDVRKPIETRGGVCHVWQKAAPGRKYAAASDPSHGVGGDHAVTVILDVTTGMVVADIQSPVLGPEALAAESIKLLAEYGNPIWAIEDNDWGGTVLSTAQAMGYKRLYYRDSETAGARQAAPSKLGWHTDERSRYLLWGELIEAVHDRLLVVPSDEGLQQFYAVIRNPEKNGRPEAMEGTHDDYPMAVGIAWQMRKHAHMTAPANQRPLRRAAAW